MLYPWELLAWLWLAFFFNQADRQVFNVIIPALGKDLAISSVQLGLVSSLFIATNALLVPVAGFFGDALSRKRIIVFSLFTWSLATLCTGFAGSLAGLIAVRSIGTAAGEAFYFPSAVAMLSAEHSSTRARALSIFQTSVYAGLIVSGWIGGAIATRWGWRAVFWIFGALGVALSLPLAFRLREQRAKAQPKRIDIGESLRAIVSTPTARFAALACSAMIFVNVGYLVWAPSYLYERFHLSLAEAGLASMLIHHLFAFLGVLLGGAVSDRLAPARPQIRLEIQAFALLAGAPFLYFLGAGSTLSVVYGALAGFGFFRGLYDSNTYPAF
jgi:MFS family permease